MRRLLQIEHLRNVAHTDRPLRRDVPLSLDLHYLMTVWADGALAGQTILAWAMHEIYHPVLDESSLSPEAQWAAGELIQLYVIEQAAGLEAHEEAFLEQPALPTVGSIRLPSVASDPRGHLLHTLRCLRCFLCYGLSPSLII